MTISPEPLHVTRRGAVLEVVLDRAEGERHRRGHQSTNGRYLRRVPRRPRTAGSGRHRRGRALLLRRLGPQGRRRGRAARHRLRGGRVRGPPGAARTQQAGDRGGQRNGGRRGARDRHFLRPHPRRRARPLRPAGDQRRGARRRGKHQAASPHPVPRRHGPPSDGPLDGGGGGGPLGPRQRGGAGPGP